MKSLHAAPVLGDSCAGGVWECTYTRGEKGSFSTCKAPQFASCKEKVLPGTPRAGRDASVLL